MKIDLPDGRQIDLPLAKLVWIPVVALVFVIGITTVFQVDTDEHGVLLRFGRHVETVGPGLHFKLPYPIDQVYKVRTQTVDVEEFGYRSQGGRAQSTRGYEEESSMLTGDLNIVQASWAVQFSRHQPEEFLFNVKDPEDTLRDISQSVMREVMGDRASIPILTVGRAEIQKRARELIQEYVDQFEMGIYVTAVNLTQVEPPDPVIDAFHDLNRAEQDAQRFFEEASREYEERVPRARGEAERVVLEAEGFRERRTNVARGEAQRFVDTLEAYRHAPNVTRRRMYLEALEERIPEMREVIIVDQEMKSILPHFNLREEN